MSHERTVRGKDEIVIMEESGRAYKVEIMKRMTLQQLKQQHPNGTCFFLVNRNVHLMPSQGRGSVLYHGDGDGDHGHIYILIQQITRKGIFVRADGATRTGSPVQYQFSCENMREEKFGYHLQQIGGEPLYYLYFGFREHRQEEWGLLDSNGHVEPLVDKHNNIKMSPYGPDIADVPDEIIRSIPKEVRDEFTSNPTNYIHRDRKKPHFHPPANIPVIYVLDSNDRIENSNNAQLFGIHIGNREELDDENLKEHFSKQKFVLIDRTTIVALFKKEKNNPHLNKHELEEWLVKQSSLPPITFLLPTLHGILRIKIVTQHEFDELVQKPDMTFFTFNGINYIHGKETKDLNNSPGVLVSSWTDHPIMLDEPVTYECMEDIVAVLGRGFGSRSRSECYGTNAYFDTRNSNRPHPQPTIAVDELSAHQYRNDEGVDFQAMFPVTRKRTSKMMNDAIALMKRLHPELGSLGGDCCTKGIVTCGGVNAPPDRHIVPLAFFNGKHVDTCDAVTKEGIQEYLEVKQECGQNVATELSPYQQRLVNFRGFSLPTTCGYQHVHRGPVNPDIDFLQYFAMNGLGMAMCLQHGIGHHFLGAAFDHQTCLCIGLERSTGRVKLSNRDDMFTILAWGRSGGSKEQRARRERLQTLRSRGNRRNSARTRNFGPPRTPRRPRGRRGRRVIQFGRRITDSC